MASVGTYYVMMGPGTRVDYSLNLACTDQWLAAGDTISSVDWDSLTPLITIDGETNTDTVASAFFRLDASAEEMNIYEVKCSYTTAVGRSDSRHIRVVVRER